MSDDRDFKAIDGSPLRENENRELRELLEQNRARRRFSRKMKYWVSWLTLGATALVTGNQLGIIDWIAGVIVKWRA